MIVLIGNRILSTYGPQNKKLIDGSRKSFYGIIGIPRAQKTRPLNDEVEIDWVSMSTKNANTHRAR